MLTDQIAYSKGKLLLLLHSNTMVKWTPLWHPLNNAFEHLNNVEHI